jgi:alpha-amylase/alpha-mannosidase (GH57 family)
MEARGIMADIALAFLWHQHQPYYPDDVSGENPMPWVRLHGVKDYYGMALHLLEFPEMRCTINLVPSLLLQIQGYIDRGATDQPLNISRLPVDALTEDDALYLLDHFFMANPDQMIRPFPRYHELYQRRALGRQAARATLLRFKERDLRDLQVWFNLAWVHPLAVEHDAGLKALHDKGHSFTEGEKTWLLEKHLEILRQIIPLHQKLAQGGQVELTTTPFFHPILPLLFDKKLAREAMPDVKLPRYTGGYPEDAIIHVRRAVEFHTRLFGTAPRGMWPAEGSVCQAMLPLLAQHGIRWIATDEEILGQSTQGFIGRDAHGHVRNPDHLYRPYRVQEQDAALAIVFRDHALSDMIGFHYQRSDPAAAAEDFVNHLHNIRDAVADGDHPALVSVILDGENCWEHYPDGGVPFLRALYRRCTTTPTVRPVTVGQFVEDHPPRDTLPRLFAGSWINHDFAIWVGHEEDNAAWDALHRTREFLQNRGQGAGGREQGAGRWGLGSETEPAAVGEVVLQSSSPTPDPWPLTPVEKAWDELYIAEGSDWFWWYGDDHSSAQLGEFDYLFRKHLQNVYLLLDEVPPPELSRAISRRGLRPLYTVPRSFLDVKIDGRLTFFGWMGAGQYTRQNERGTMALVTTGPIKNLYFGFDLETLLVRVDFDGPARTALEGYEELAIGILEPAGWRASIQPGPHGWGAQSATIALSHRSRPVADPGLAVGIDQIVEAAIPFAALGLTADQPVAFYVELLQDGQSRDRAPREGPIQLQVPAENFELVMWDV